LWQVAQVRFTGLPRPMVFRWVASRIQKVRSRKTSAPRATDCLNARWRRSPSAARVPCQRAGARIEALRPEQLVFERRDPGQLLSAGRALHLQVGDGRLDRLGL
jgi:hypothetical protein